MTNADDFYYLGDETDKKRVRVLKRDGEKESSGENIRHVNGRRILYELMCIAKFFPIFIAA